MIMIKERTREVVPTLISEDQTNRFTGNNTRFIYDLINYCNTNRLTGLLLCIDLKKPSITCLDFHAKGIRVSE